MAVDFRVLRTLLTPEINIVVGRAMMARVVVADGSGRGSLSIAGYLLEAELPKDVRAGDDLRLVVRDVNAERVLLGISDSHQETPPPPVPLAAPVTIPLPGGGSVQVTERDAGGAQASSQDAHTLSLRYDAPALGAVEVRFELNPTSLRLGVTVAAGLGRRQRSGSDGYAQPQGGGIEFETHLDSAQRRGVVAQAQRVRVL